MVNKESNDHTGTDNAPSIGGSNLAKDDDNVKMSLSQQKMVSIVRTISGLLGKDIKEWLEMAEVFLDNEQIIELFSNDGDEENDIADMNAFRNSRHTSISVTVGTQVAKQQELQQLNMLMQQSKVLGEQLPPKHIASLVARMYDLFDMYEDATALRNFVPEPSEQEQAMQQIQMQTAMVELQLLQAQISEVQSRIQLNNSTSGAKQLDSQSGAMYKQAQIGEKNSKSEAHQVNSALRPGEAMMEMQEKLKQLKEKGNANG